jgi:hypothetical protein
LKRVIDAILALLDLDFGGAADLDDGNAASELGKPLLQLFLVIIGRGCLDLGADLLDTGLDIITRTGTVDDGGVVLVD